MNGRKLIAIVFLIILAGFGAGVWILLTPGNPLTRIFSQKISDVDSRIVIGPFPSARDMDLLKANGVTLVVSLLNPEIPYEAVLLEREKAASQKLGLRVLNFPMSSILGHRFGNDYDGNAAKAAAAILSTTEKVYLHCYLGIHRIQAVRDLLSAQGVEAGTYKAAKGEREAKATLVDMAETSYNAGRYQEALDLLAKVDAKKLSDNGKLLRAWSHYRIWQIKEARALFEQFLSMSPGHPQATIGLGYCAYRENDFAAAEKHFNDALRKLPDNADALGGKGLAAWRAGRTKDAITALEASLKIAPENKELRDVLARLKGPK